MKVLRGRYCVSYAYTYVYKGGTRARAHTHTRSCTVCIYNISARVNFVFDVSYGDVNAGLYMIFSVSSLPPEKYYLHYREFRENDVSVALAYNARKKLNPKYRVYLSMTR